MASEPPPFEPLYTPFWFDDLLCELDECLSCELFEDLWLRDAADDLSSLDFEPDRDLDRLDECLRSLVLGLFDDEDEDSANRSELW